jgi:hypothetical protein
LSPTHELDAALGIGRAITTNENNSAAKLEDIQKIGKTICKEFIPMVVRRGQIWTWQHEKLVEQCMF